MRPTACRCDHYSRIVERIATCQGWQQKKPSRFTTPAGLRDPIAKGKACYQIRRWKSSVGGLQPCRGDLGRRGATALRPCCNRFAIVGQNVIALSCSLRCNSRKFSRPRPFVIFAITHHDPRPLPCILVRERRLDKWQAVRGVLFKHQANRQSCTIYFIPQVSDLTQDLPSVPKLFLFVICQSSLHVVLCWGCAGAYPGGGVGACCCNRFDYAFRIIAMFSAVSSISRSAR
jgi:hypothetical protein